MNDPAAQREYYRTCAFPKPTHKSDRKKQLRNDAQACKNYVKAHPYCESCGATATGAHHVEFKQIGGTRTEVADRELMSLCDACHGDAHYLKVVAA